MKVHAFPRSDAGAAAYLEVLPRLGAAGFEPWAAAYARVHAARIAWDIDYLNRTHRPVRCLNVGGAPYLFELLMRQARPDLEITTLDLDPDRFPRVESVLGVRLVRLDVETASADALKALGRFDCIVLTEVFEHLRIDLLGTMSRLGALLTDDGVLYLSTPNGASLAAWRRAYLKGRTGPRPVDAWGRLQTLGHMGHVREYAMIEVQEVLAHCGYEVMDGWFRFGLRAPASLGARLRNLVQTVVHAPCGAHPTYLGPNYGLDMEHLKAYNASASEEGGWQKYMDEFVNIGETAYLAKVGGAERVSKLKLPVY